MLTDAFAQAQNPSASFYTTKGVQLANGCYYRIIVAYKTGIKTGQSQILVFKKSNFEYKKTAEVYEFYLHDAMQGDKTENTETKALGELKRAEKENQGYAGNRTMGIGLIFCKDYRDYVARFGAVSYYGHELTGVTDSLALDVVRITEMEREYAESNPQDWYVIERTNIDGIVFWQEARTGIIFRTAPKTMPVEMCDSLTSYVRFH